LHLDNQQHLHLVMKSITTTPCLDLKMIFKIIGTKL